MSIRAGRLIGPSLFLSFIFSFTASGQVQASAKSANAQPGTVLSLITQAVDETRLAVMKGNTHPLARAQYDQGAAPLDLPMNRMLLVLRRSDTQETALRKLLDDQQDKSSPNYHKWLTPEDFGKQFGPSDQDIQTVTTWLQSHGFQVAQVAKGRNVIEFSGTAAQVQEALHTEIHKYVVNGEEHWANAKDPAIPAALKPVVNGILTLHNFFKKPNIAISQTQIEAKYVPGKRPQFTSGTKHALTPADYYAIYNISPLFGGFSASIGVVGRSNINLQDITYFHYWMYDQAIQPEVILNGVDPGDLGGGEEAEAVLDTTWSGALAPSAFVTLVVSASTNTTDGVDLSESYIIDNNLSDVMTESFGDCEANYTSTQASGIASLAQQAAAQGITYLVSSGDSGSAGCDDPNTETQATHPPSVNILASSPYTVAVGGTIFNENGHETSYWSSTNDPNTLGSAISYIPENVWNESCTAAQCGGSANIWAGGGGASAFFTKPSWQTGVAGIPSDHVRDLPDVSLTAAGHDPYLLCLQGSCIPDSQGYIHFWGISGTSASAPSFAGIMAMVGQKTGSRQGQPNYVLYRLAAAEDVSQCNGSNTGSLPSSSCVFNDVTVGNNAVPGESSYGTPSAPYQSTKAYDLATGLGSVNVTNLLNAWNTVTFNPTSTTFSITPVTATHGSPLNINVNVVSNSGIGTPSGPVWLQGGTAHGNLVGDSTVAVFTLDGTGSVSTNIHLLPGGTYQTNAHYAGDGTFAPSDSTPPVMVTIQPEPSTTTLSVLTIDQSGNLIPFAGGPYGSPVFLKAHVAGQSGYGVPTSYVNMWDNGGNAVAGPYVDKDGDATSQRISQFSIGTHSIVAGYYGDQSFNSSVSSQVSFSVNPASTTTSVTFQPGAQGATLVATVDTAGYGSSPSGTVTFYSANSSLGTFAVSGGNSPSGTAQAIATLSDSQLNNNQTYVINATYSGDTNYITSTGSGTVTLHPDFAMTESTGSANISPGGSTSMSVSISAEDGFNNPVALSCSGLPSEAKCSFSPASITGTGISTLTITSAAPKTAILERQNYHHQGWWMFSSASLFAGIVLLGGPKKRRSWTSLLSLVIFAFLLTLPACGGGNSSSGGGGGQSDPGTPTGTSNVTITATGGSVTHTTTFTLVVQ